MSAWNKERLLRLLDAHGIAYTAVDHPPVATMAESARLGLPLKGSRCKNLAVRNKAGTRNLLVVVPPDKGVDLGSLGRELGVGRLSLCQSEGLLDLLGVRPGALSPFALAADGPPARFTLILDRAVAHEPFLLMHPMVNTATLSIAQADFRRFLQIVEHEPLVHDIADRQGAPSNR